MAISLIKGQKISLKKDDGSSLVDFCVGANWGAISKTGLLATLKSCRLIWIYLLLVLIVIKI